MQFSEVIGQNEAKRKLKLMVEAGRLPHALLISGSEGSGTLPLALALAQYINCESPGDDSCGQCSSCIKIKKHMHPDVFYTYPTIAKKSGDKPVSTDFITEWRKALGENYYLTYNEWLNQIGAENKQGNITTKECQEIVRHISMKAYEAQYKIQIIWMAELLRETGNVLLKSIEEPPPNTIFILVTEQPELILTTILSRTQMLRLPPIETAEIEKAISDKLDVDRKQEAAELAFLSNGNWVTAKELLEQEETDVEELFLSWLRYSAARFSAQSVGGLYNWIEAFQPIGREKQKLMIRYGLFFIENCLEQLTTGNNRLKGQALEVSIKISERYPLSTLVKVNEILNKFHYHIERNANPKIIAMSNSLEISAAFNS